MRGLLVAILLLGIIPLPGGPLLCVPALAAPEQGEIDAALAKGTAFLRKQQRQDGSFSRNAGKTGLGLLALAHAGIPADDPAMIRGVRYLQSSLVRPDNYAACLAIMALATLDPEGQAKRIKRLAQLIEMAQCENGQWSYRLRKGRAGGDNSNTQFSVLALWYARQAGVRTAPEIFAATRKFFERTQNEDGGWGYAEKERKKSYGSMTATGLAALVICRAGEEGIPIGDERVRQGESVGKALGWLGAHLALDRNPEANFRLGSNTRGVRKEVTDSFWRHYWLWSLERAATLAGVDRIGERDWYGEGAAWLIKSQRDNGSWVGSEASFEATAFAVLFLSRSMRRTVATEKERLQGTATPDPR